MDSPEREPDNTSSPEEEESEESYADSLRRESAAGFKVVEKMIKEDREQGRLPSIPKDQ